MSQIDVTRTHNISLKAGQKLLSDFATKLKDEYGGTYEHTDTGIRFEGPGISGDVIVDKTTIRIVAKLGFLTRAFKSTIENKINETLDDVLKK